MSRHMRQWQKTAARFLGLACFLAMAAPLPGTAADYQLQVTADQETAIYDVGAKANFLVRITRDGQAVEQATVSYTVDDYITGPRFDGRSFPKGTLNLKQGEASIPITSDRPLFLRCRVTWETPEKKKLGATAGVGFSPLKIEPSMPVPDDFDQFWADQKKKLAQVPMEPKLTPVKQDHRWLDCFDVQLRCLGGAPVSGYLAVQRGGKPRSLPIVLWVHGAGVRSSTLTNAITGARAGMLSMDINAHGIPNGKPAAYYSELARTTLKNYRYAGRENREMSYFRGMFLRIVRAIDYLTSRPEWDGKTVIVVGHSQGGGQALVAGGLDPRVTMIAAGVPAICDHSGRVVGRINGWPKLVPMGPDGKPDPKILQASRYVDAVNFASRCKAEAIMSVGLIDSVCPPASCYAAYNSLRGPKSIINEPLMSHAAPPRIQRAFMERLLLHAQKKSARQLQPAG